MDMVNPRPELPPGCSVQTPWSKVEEALQTECTLPAKHEDRKGETGVCQPCSLYQAREGRGLTEFPSTTGSLCYTDGKIVAISQLSSGCEACVLYPHGVTLSTCHMPGTEQAKPVSTQLAGDTCSHLLSVRLGPSPSPRLALRFSRVAAHEMTEWTQHHTLCSAVTCCRVTRLSPQLPGGRGSRWRTGRL